MGLETIVTLLLGTLAVAWGMRLGRVLLRKGATASNLFQGKNAASMAFLGSYMGLLLLALYVPQLQALPLEWRVSGMRVTWTLIRVMLLGFCGLAWVVSWKTARLQVVAVVLLGLLGLGSFLAAEAYFLAPIHASLHDNLLPNGIFQQTSNSSCAPAALATVLRRWGIEATESSVAEAAGTSRLGTSMPQLIVATQAIGMDAIELAPTWEQMRRINRPGVLATWLYSETGRAPHTVSLLAMTQNTVTIADPAFGKFYELDPAQFEHVWRHQYLPVFLPEDRTLAPDRAADYLRRLGYLDAATPLTPDRLQQAIQQFQTAVGVNVTGNLDPATALLLSGPFLANQPRLDSPLP
ncbi:MAG: peptidoglycan-binding protein [Synechococcales cyanobacterium M58_A2018_015]|nr:peptidoglycan-binding protein [Synechococcales cyanobacterium M58_A2018_015]